MVVNTLRLILLTASFIILSVECTLVTKHKPQTAKTASAGQKGRHGDTVHENYITGECIETYDDLTLYDQSYGQCLTECKSRSQCSAVNFYIKLGVCRLNFRTDKTRKSCPKYVLSEKKNWKQKSIPGCEKKKCPNTHKCIVIKRKPVCVATSCENIHSLKNGVIYGNRVEIGKKRGFRCNKGYNLIGSSKTTCMADGKWSHKEPFCEADKTTTRSGTRTSSQKTTPLNTIHRSITKPSTSTTPPNSKTSVNKNVTKNLTVSTVTTSRLTTQTRTYWTYSTVMMSVHGDPFMTSSITTPVDMGTSDGALYGQYCDMRNKMCFEENQECRRRECQCIFGFAFDPIKATCVQGCEKLGTTYQVHAKVFPDYNEAPSGTFYVESSMECSEICSTFYQCTVSIVTWNQSTHSNKTCLLYETTLEEMDKRFNSFSVTYIRDCSDGLSSNNTGPQILKGDSTNPTPPYRENSKETNDSLGKSNGGEIIITTTAETHTSKQIDDGTDHPDRGELTTDTLESNSKTSSLVDDSVPDNTAIGLETTALSVSTTHTFSSTMTTTSDLTSQSDTFHFLSPVRCALGKIYSQKRGGCTEKVCDIYVNTYQLFNNTEIPYLEDDVIDEMTDLHDCLLNCLSIPSCNSVFEIRYANGNAECFLLEIKDLPPPEDVKVKRKRALYMRDCE